MKMLKLSSFDISNFSAKYHLIIVAAFCRVEYRLYREMYVDSHKLLPEN